MYGYNDCRFGIAHGTGWLQGYDSAYFPTIERPRCKEESARIERSLGVCCASPLSWRIFPISIGTIRRCLQGKDIGTDESAFQVVVVTYCLSRERDAASRLLQGASVSFVFSCLLSFQFSVLSFDTAIMYVVVQPVQIQITSEI